MPLATDKGLTHRATKRNVDETVERLKSILHQKGATLFALVDHSGEAEKVGLKMPPTQLLIFGNPKAGTPLMQAAPTAAVDLPLKILVWQDAQEKVWLTYNTPSYITDRHGLSSSFLPALSIVDKLAAAVAE